MKVLFGIVAALVALARANDDDGNGLDSYYCAELFNGNNGNSAGYFQLKLDQHGWSKYNFNLDLTGEVCSSGSDLTYHLHVNTTDSDGSFSCASCGGHYDPFFGCSASSSEATAGCSDLNRDSTTYSTRCVAPSNLQSTYKLPDGGCEVGDLSSKFGLAESKDENSMIYYNLETLTDYFPPMLANFKATTYAAGPWNSVVFHCPAGNERLACGNFVSTDKEGTGTACTSFEGSTWSDQSGDGGNNNDDDAQLSVASGNALIVMTVLLGLSTLGLCGYVWKTTKGQRADPGLLSGV